MSEKLGPSQASMPVIAEFKIRRRAYLSADGQVLAPLPQFATDAKNLIPLYRSMVLLRSVDAKAVALQRTGRLGTYPVALGQEAVQIGTASAMRAEDVFFPTYRENGALMWRGVTIDEILNYWGGDERGSDFAGPRQDFPICIPVGSHAPHAAGAAYAFKLQRRDRVAVCILGDGATSKGDVYEALNFAAVHRLPAVFVINNNRWAISVPVRLQTATATLAQKAIAAGMPGEQVDGNDIVAVRASVEEAIAEARSGLGPTLIEAVTYRLGDHTTADDARRYRPDDEVQARWKEDPIARLKKYLTAQGVWSKQDEEHLVSGCQQDVEAAVARYLALPPREPTSMFDHLYRELPAALERQRDILAERDDD